MRKYAKITPRTKVLYKRLFVGENMKLALVTKDGLRHLDAQETTLLLQIFEPRRNMEELICEFMDKVLNRYGDN